MPNSLQNSTNPLQNKFWRSFAKSPITMIKLDDSVSHAEPLHAKLDKDAHHQIWFFTSRTNRLAHGGRAMAQFASKDHDLFACMSGTVVEEVDPALCEKLWSNEEEAWFPNGREDPNAIMLRFDIDDAEVWTVEPGIAGKFKLMTGIPIEQKEVGEHGVGQI